MRILVADDHPLFREALELSIGFQWPDAEFVFVETLDGEVLAVTGVLGQVFDLIVLDWNMPGIGDSDPITRLRECGVRGPVAVMTGAERPAIAIEAFRSGAAAFLPKTTPRRVLGPSLKVVMEGGTTVPAEILMALAGEDSLGAADDDGADADGPGEQAALTDRERDVFSLLSTGATNKEIARQLELAEVTVKFHTRRIFKKLGARNRADAVRRAQEIGLLDGSGP
ncbi:LuxR C-terminal-related transcriptional regulator [Azospirillum picis]|uniref:DNA-binding NarL/FixJ family response regulator n=1 Tax=Azospirillum picis TaxID=488438 RepID=A0ABU0MV89_9PROT|nr:response regulator transcription factor [Azospirillum picis]MBP2303511.1 DNA-binding NarL/FixJ family response regulator [Azospirillum picis]MDQ0537414.1 DNA-binding NarL/FixJ family response regulator [Azospirillum picis]